MNKPKHAAFRHSLLNFGHINLLDSEDPETKVCLSFPLFFKLLVLAFFLPII